MSKCHQCSQQLLRTPTDNEKPFYRISELGKLKNFCLPCWRKEEKNCRSKFTEKDDSINYGFITKTLRGKYLFFSSNKFSNNNFVRSYQLFFQSKNQ